MPVEQVFSLLDGYSAPANNTDEIFYTGSLLGSKYNVCTATISGRSVVTKTLVGGAAYHRLYVHRGHIAV
jgi:hypothetical protein